MQIDAELGSAPWRFLITVALLGLVLVGVFDNLPILLFLAAGLLIMLRFAYKTFLRPYLRVLRMRRAREARALREAINSSAHPSDS